MYVLRILILVLVCLTQVYSETEEDHGVKYADKCEGK